MKFKRTIVWTSVILIWFLFTIYQLDPEFNQSPAIPNPYLVFKRFIEIFQDGFANHSIWEHMFASFWRLFVAILLAIVTAIPLGLLCGYKKKIEVVVSTIVDFVRPLPPLAYYVIIIIASKSIGDEPKIILLFIAAFAPLYIACVQAVKQVRKDHILAVKTLGASNFEVFRHVVIPSALPNVFTGLRTAIGVSYTTLVSAEMVAATVGLGYIIKYAYDYYQTEVVFVGIIIIGISAMLLDDVLKWSEKKVIFWKGES